MLLPEDRLQTRIPGDVVGVGNQMELNRSPTHIDGFPHLDLIVACDSTLSLRKWNLCLIWALYLPMYYFQANAYNLRGVLAINHWQ